MPRPGRSSLRVTRRRNLRHGSYGHWLRRATRSPRLVCGNRTDRRETAEDGTEKMGYRICLISMLAGILAACETAFDPATGQIETRLTLPFTAANAAAAEVQWR